MLLKADILLVLDDIRRILPEPDPIQVLVSRPQVCREDGRRIGSLMCSADGAVDRGLRIMWVRRGLT